MYLTPQDLQAIRILIREETQPHFQDIDKRFGGINERLENLREETDKKIKALDNSLRTFRKETNQRFDTIDDRLDDIVQELVQFTGELYQDHDKRICRLERKAQINTS